MQRRPSALQCLALTACLCLLAQGCASVSLKRSTKTSGTYTSTGWAFTLFSIDMPSSAMKIARENAADFHLANTTETAASLTPDVGWWNWVFDIISIRRAKVQGTWGFEDK